MGYWAVKYYENIAEGEKITASFEAITFQYFPLSETDDNILYIYIPQICANGVKRKNFLRTSK